VTVVEGVAHHRLEGTLPRVPRPPIAALLLTVAVIGGAACGADTEGVPDDQAVRAAVARFGVATRAKDYQTICDRLLTDELVAKVEAVGLPCESALQRGLTDVRDPTLTIRQVSVSGGRALVSVHSTAAGQPDSDDAVQLVKQGEEWRIASLAAPAPGQATPTTPATPPTTATTKSSSR
jgi:ketosteroid isomerase-like protein